jgi:hypothetical protein
LPAADDRIGDPHVLDAGVREDLRLAELGHRQAGGACLELQPRDLGHLVGLGVRPQRDPAGSRACRHRRDVAAHHARVDDEGRRVAPVQGHAPSAT